MKFFWRMFLGVLFSILAIVYLAWTLHPTWQIFFEFVQTAGKGFIFAVLMVGSIFFFTFKKK